MKILTTLLCCIVISYTSFGQKNKNYNKTAFLSNLRIEAGPHYQFDHFLINQENVRFKAYGLHGRAKYSFNEIVQVNFGGNLYKSKYWYEKDVFEFSPYASVLLNPLHSILRNQTSLFNHVQPLIGFGYEGDTFLGRTNKWHGATLNVSIAYVSPFLTVEYAIKNRLWRRNSQQFSFFPKDELNTLSTFSLLFNFMSWNKNLSKRRKAVKSSFYEKGL